jgi:hypothetical protein
MKIGNASIDKLARMICGDLPYGDFPHRSSSYLTSFFEEIDLNYIHDGSTRYWWVRSVLLELNELPEVSESLPSAEMILVIEYLVDPDHFSEGNDCGQQDAIERVNEMFRRFELQIEREPTTGNVKVTSLAEGYVSTAVPKEKVRKTITFAPAVFSVPEAEPDPTLVAVMMPFGAEFNPIYKAIRGSCQEAGFQCYRADDIWENSTFIQDIFDLIFKAAIVIVDFSGRNPNVMYETGIAHTLGKIVVPLTQNIADIPSDLKPHRALKYLPNPEGLRDLSTQLAKRLTTIRTQLGLVPSDGSSEVSRK